MKLDYLWNNQIFSVLFSDGSKIKQILLKLRYYAFLYRDTLIELIMYLVLLLGLFIHVFKSRETNKLFQKQSRNHIHMLNHKQTFLKRNNLINSKVKKIIVNYRVP